VLDSRVALRLLNNWFYNPLPLLSVPLAPPPPSQDPREALRVALDASLIRPIDVATVNGRPFLNVAVAGGVADVPPDELSSKWKRLLGPLAIAFFGEWVGGWAAGVDGPLS